MTIHFWVSDKLREFRFGEVPFFLQVLKWNIYILKWRHHFLGFSSLQQKFSGVFFTCWFCQLMVFFGGFWDPRNSNHRAPRFNQWAISWFWKIFPPPEWKSNIIFLATFKGDMLLPWRVNDDAGRLTFNNLHPSTGVKHVTFRQGRLPQTPPLDVSGDRETLMSGRSSLDSVCHRDVACEAWSLPQESHKNIVTWEDGGMEHNVVGARAKGES